MKSETIAGIQQAGAALHNASQLLIQEVEMQQARVREALAADAFNISTDVHFDDWKSLARMAQVVAAMEEQLKQIYFAAMGVGHGKPFGEKPLLSTVPAAAQDVVDVPARRVARTGRQRHIASQSGQDNAVGLKGNAGKILAFLKTKVSREGFTRVTHAELAAGVPLAVGSVGFAIGSLKSKGLLEEGDKGHYRLL